MPIHQEVNFKCSAKRIFDALTKVNDFAELTGAPTEIDANAGGQFSCFGGMITGMTIEVVPNKRLVQAWKVADWEEGVYSIVRFDLVEINKSESMLVFDHTGFPEEHKEDLVQGWYQWYWEPMKTYLEK
ncbi:hypothetical protein A9Q85_03740 [Cycloclasticus sp. 44_32_T64]|nr:hypothetical protein A9Q85_03740 [Cycloclasticus sp. 44_32_T64]